MAHHHLRFQILNNLKRNTNNDQNGGSADGDGRECAVEEAQHNGENGYNAESESTHKGNSGDNALQEICCGLSGADTGNGTAVLSQVVCHLSCVVLDSYVEIRKCDDENEIKNCIERSAYAEHRESLIEPIVCIGHKGKDHCGQHKDRRSKDDGHNA